MSDTSLDIDVSESNVEMTIEPEVVDEGENAPVPQEEAPEEEEEIPRPFEHSMTLNPQTQKKKKADCAIM